MNMMTTMSPPGAIVRQPHRLIALARMLDAQTDAQLEATIEMLIAIRDARDTDPDLEPNGDERDGTGAEDEEPLGKSYPDGPGCPISDPGGAAHGEDDEEDYDAGGNVTDEPHDGDEDEEHARYARPYHLARR